MSDTNYGKFYDSVNANRMFIGSTAAAGVVPPIYSNTAQTFMVMNPVGSGVNIVPVRLRVSLITVGVVTANFVYGQRTDAGASIATGAIVSAATLVAAANAKLGSGTASKALFAPATATTTAPTYLMATGISICMATTPTAMNNFWELSEDYDGTFIVPPGVALFVANNIAGVATWGIKLNWLEVPI